MMNPARMLCALAILAAAACGSDADVKTNASSPTESNCDRVTEFADALVDTESADYQPSASPATLATRSDVVIAGRLTGELAHRDARTDEPVTSWIAFEVEVTKVAHGSPEVSDAVYVAVPYDPSHRPASGYEELVVPGLEVVVFAQELPDPPAELFVGAEGFATACDDGVAIGRLGSSPAWEEAGTLSALFTAAGEPTDRAEVALWHCGIETITVDDRRWEVPNDEEPFDGTNAPSTFAGAGTIERVDPDELRYTDDSGVVLRFVPDDNTEPPCA